jgi:predicted phosphodiesterase
MKEPVRILSDLHLGHRVSRIAQVASLRPLIAGAGTVIFNGDTWQELARLFKESSAAMLQELRELCAAEGAEAVFLPGNHDPGWEGAGWAELAGGRILVVHGDALFAEGSPWSREAFSRGEQVRQLWAEHRDAEHDPAERILLARKIAVALRTVEYPRGKRLWHRVLEAVRPPRRAWQMLRVWALQAEAAATFAGQYFPKAEVIIIGHFHRAGIWRRKGRLVINTGSYMNPGAALWAEYAAGVLSCGKVDERAEPYTLGKKLGVWRMWGV